MRSGWLAFFSILAIPAWAAVFYVMLLAYSLGDANTGMEIAKAKVLLLPFGYFLILFFSCFRFVRGGMLLLAKVLSSILLIGFAIGAFTFGWTGIFLWLPIIPYAVASWNLFRKENAPHP